MIASVRTLNMFFLLKKNYVGSSGARCAIKPAAWSEDLNPIFACLPSVVVAIAAETTSVAVAFLSPTPTYLGG